MLEEWLGPITIDAFVSQQLQRVPIAQPSSIGNPEALLDWGRLDRVLASDAGDTLVVSRGELLPFPQPRGLLELRAYMRDGIGLCIRHAERCDPVLARIAAQFERDIGTSMVQLFVTPRATHGFGWHFDDEDVFIAQTAGVKDYYFRPNTVTVGPADSTKFAAFSRETSQLHTATLHPGDFLYIPARWWHMALCRETSLSVSVGVFPAAQRGSANT